MNVYEARHTGREYCCKTEGSEHYKEGGVEPLDLMIAKGLAEDFCIGNVSKYAFRFKKTRNLEDLKKVSDYAHILCGVELGKINEAERVNMDKPVEPWGEEDEARINRLLCNKLVKESCDGGCPFSRNVIMGDNYCDNWYKSHPAEARKIMDKWEAERSKHTEVKENVEPWSRKDNIRLIRMCEVQCGECPLQISSKTNERGMDCSSFCVKYPDKVRAILDKREAERHE